MLLCCYVSHLETDMNNLQTVGIGIMHPEIIVARFIRCPESKRARGMALQILISHFMLII